MTNNKHTLLILAAGISSRYGTLKQLDPIGKNGETIMDYSIYDAIQSGFKKIVFVIRKDFFKSFQSLVEKRWKEKIELAYAFQSIKINYNGKIINREKPWGTGHAVLSAQKLINEPFCVINADDFYGRDCFKKMHNFLTNKISQNLYCMIAFKLYNTLSEYGSVSRGICIFNSKSSMFEKVEEKEKIYKKGEKIFSKKNNLEIELDGKKLVSMNFWGLHPDIFQIGKIIFLDFLSKNFKNSNSEFFLPDLITHKITNKKAMIEVIPTSTKWFGITYKKDKQKVTSEIELLVKKKIYPKKL